MREKGACEEDGGNWALSDSNPAWCVHPMQPAGAGRERGLFQGVRRMSRG